VTPIHEETKTNNMQQYVKIFIIILYLYDAQHVSGRHTAHHQEPKTVVGGHYQAHCA
jgi:hypothetical protein